MDRRTDKLLLGVDIGTNESKGVLIDGSFRPVADFAVPHTMENPQPTTLKWMLKSGGLIFAKSAVASWKRLG